MQPDRTIRKMTARLAGILAENEPSIYLYGSCALGDFRFGWSDIDLLVLLQKPVSEEQAEELVGLRQTMSAEEPDEPLYRCFEGGMLTLDALVRGLPDRVVYWGTSGQRLADRYALGACSLCDLLDHGVLMCGKEVRGELARPSYEALTADIRFHLDTIRRYAQKTGRSVYSYGWLLDIARCVYTLRTGEIIGKTAAGEWALREGLFRDPAALREALTVRKAPRRFAQSAELQRRAEELGEAVQRYADVLEAELCAACPGR